MNRLRVRFENRTIPATRRVIPRHKTRNLAPVKHLARINRCNARVLGCRVLRMRKHTRQRTPSDRLHVSARLVANAAAIFTDDDDVRLARLARHVKIRRNDHREAASTCGPRLQALLASYSRMRKDNSMLTV
jgi:hypothetical protein